MDVRHARHRRDGDDLITQCVDRSLALLECNLSPHGILAATPGPEAEARRYTRIFGRDAAICALAMVGSGNDALEAGAIASLDALAAMQALNGQIPKFVDPAGGAAAFWYVGCIDATLWWLIAVDAVRREHADTPLAGRWDAEVARALQWLLAQEHQAFYLLQQNEASDWADIMPRSGFVLYTNALWYHVKRRFGLPRQEETHYYFNHLFYPFHRELPEHGRARLMRHYVQRRARNRELYLSFVNLSVCGDEGDTFGNLLAVLFGLASDTMAARVIRVLEQRHAAVPLPLRVVLDPIPTSHELWRDYMARHRQNFEHQYHNGGIWPFVGGFWVMCLAGLGRTERASQALEQVARANRVGDWRFTEWFHAQTLAPSGMAGQSWNAATFLLAHRMLARGSSPLR
jgi:hypothetical protein